MTPRVLGHALWRNDADRALEARVAHLLDKPGVTRWHWMVGDSIDDTEARLRAVANTEPRVSVFRHDTGRDADDPPTRFRRFSDTADALLDQVGPDVDRILIHESDLTSPRDIVTALAGTAHEAVAGWPVLPIATPPLFYDTWGYTAGGRHFTNWPPYHPVYRADQRFAVDTVGSCWTLPAWAVRDGARCHGRACHGLCAELRERGVAILVDPRVEIVQPPVLWTFAGPPLIVRPVEAD